MKQFWIDLCCVLLLICVINLFFGDHQVSQTLFEREIDQFEEDISLQKEIQSSVTLQDTSDNQVSSLMKTTSQICVSVIEFFAGIFSDFISLFLFDFSFRLLL